MVKIRPGQTPDLPRVSEFYRSAGYSGTLAPEDETFLVEDGDLVVGAVRLAREGDGVTVLRGMRLSPSHQRLGVGTRLLEAVSAALGPRACYCIPYAHLLGFYAQAGFQEVDPSTAPAFLAARLDEYRRSRAQSFRLMYRPGRSGGLSSSGGSLS